MLNDANEAWDHFAKRLSRQRKPAPIFQSNEKQFSDVNNMIDCSLIQGYQDRYAVGLFTTPSRHFL